jgi:hypothetical protein
MMENFMTNQNQKFDELTKKVDMLATQNKLLENQVAQQVTQFSRQPGTLLPKPENNPRDVKAVRHMLRSGAQYEDPPMPKDDYVQPQSLKGSYTKYTKRPLQTSKAISRGVAKGKCKGTSLHPSSQIRTFPW